MHVAHITAVPLVRGLFWASSLSKYLARMGNIHDSVALHHPNTQIPSTLRPSLAPGYTREVGVLISSAEPGKWARAVSQTRTPKHWEPVTLPE